MLTSLTGLAITQVKSKKLAPGAQPSGMDIVQEFSAQSSHNLFSLPQCEGIVRLAVNSTDVKNL